MRHTITTVEWKKKAWKEQLPQHAMPTTTKKTFMKKYCSSETEPIKQQQKWVISQVQYNFQ